MFDSNRNIQKEVLLDSKNIKYTLKVSKRARVVRLAIYHDGSFVVTIPQKVNEKVAEEFIIKKSKWITEKIEYFKKNPRTTITKHTLKEIKEYKEKTGECARLRLQYWNNFYNFTYKKITIKNTKSRWGSCSRTGNINFNYKIIFLPQELADYIIVHELCHLGEMNHSANFWKLVERTIPNYKVLRKELKKMCL